MIAKDFEGKQCPYSECKKGTLKAMTQNALTCSDCQSTFILTYLDDLDKGRRVFLAQRQNPEFFNRTRQLSSEGKMDWVEIYQLVEKEDIPLYSSPLYILGYKDHREMTS